MLILQSLVSRGFLASNVNDISPIREKRLYKALKTRTRIKKGKHARKKDKTKMTCYSCGKMGYFTHECTKLKKELSNSTLSYETYVSSIILLIESHLMWIVDLWATNHVTHDKGVFMEFHQIAKETRWIYVINNTKVKIKEIDTSKLVL